MSASTSPLPPLPPRCAVSVIVPARDAGATLAAAVRSALSQEPAVREVLVACDPQDRSTRDAAARLARDDDRVRLVDAPGGRTPVALRAAAGAASGEVVVRLDAHAVLPAGYVARAVETLRRTGAGNVGGRQVPTARGGFPAAVAAAMASPVGAGGAAYRTGQSEGPVDTVYLGVFRREALQEVGSFDPRMLRNQDAELNLRLTRAGYTVWFDPQLAVAYTPRDTLAGLASQYWQYGRWRRMTARLHPGSLRARQLAAPTLVVGLAASAVTAGVRGRWSLLGVPLGGYGAVLLAAGWRAAGVRPAPATAAALGTMHLAWGLGFLAGPPREAGGARSATTGIDRP